MYGSAAVDITQYRHRLFTAAVTRSVVIISMVRAVVTILMFLASFVAGLWLATTLARADGAPLPIVGAWTLNKELSDVPATGERQSEGGGRGEHGRGDHGRGEHGHGGYRGGYGGGTGSGGGAREGGRGEDMARRRDAIHEIMTPPERLTITATESMVIVTDGDGRTTRLSLDGKKIKDQSTSIERKTKWDGAKLTTEISGAGPGTIIQTLQVDPEHHQLIVSLQPPAKDGSPMPHRVVYDPAAR
jgi:hypothetical protein